MSAGPTMNFALRDLASLERRGNYVNPSFVPSTMTSLHVRGGGGVGVQRDHLRTPKTVNNVLTVLNVPLKKAVEWDVIERMPCTIRLLRTPKSAASFYDLISEDGPP